MRGTINMISNVGILWTLWLLKLINGFDQQLILKRGSPCYAFSMLQPLPRLPRYAIIVAMEQIEKVPWLQQHRKLSTIAFRASSNGGVGEQASAALPSVPCICSIYFTLDLPLGAWLFTRAVELVASLWLAFLGRLTNQHINVSKFLFALVDVCGCCLPWPYYTSYLVY